MHKNILAGPERISHSYQIAQKVCMTALCNVFMIFAN